ncbi:MAG: light-regulated signal transduction histidine kinase (bacteriophytochrome) [Psychroserpens sp.]|jgi:light-regulated signal transduction histidine kinase (bacteriophytochrome)|uniref:sensor histidine kinase n=1 Tax=Psychroserpens sp. TaxID=2020870 RepID=UPI0039E2F878
MTSLLKRQIRKYLTPELAASKNLEAFLDAINRSYSNFDEQFAMQQRAMSISSDELFEANEKLKTEAESQKEVIDKLKHVLETLKFYKLPEDNTMHDVDLDGSKLVDFIDGQTREIVEINKQRELLVNELAHQNQELSDYAHMVSHDLKSPLRSIDALSAWLKEDYKDKLDENGSKNLDLIRNSVEKMDSLINGILEYSTINKNRIEIYDVNLNLVIDDILNSIQVPEHITIIKNELPVILGDKYRLQQLFQNLIVNAITNNDKTQGEVEIGMKDAGAFWEFFVKDNGKGIEELYFDKIFKTFESLESNVNSTGIGLSIVKKIIDLYKGSVWLTSEIGQGTTFYFTLKK